MTPDQESLDALKWWTQPDNVMVGKSLGETSPDLQLFSDASDWGWGAWLDQQEVSSPWTSQMRSRSINYRELWAIGLALRHFLPQVQGHVVQVYADNCTAVAYLQKQGGTVSWELFLLSRQILYWCKRNQIQVRARYIPGELNVRADALSRRPENLAKELQSPKAVLATEWRIHPLVLPEIWRARHRPLVDLFATRDNAVLNLYYSPVPDPGALGVDALFHSWQGLDAYAFPPINLVHTVVKKIEKTKCRVLLVAPMWPRRAWYPSLVLMSRSEPLALSQRPDLLVQGPHRDALYPEVELLQLHVWDISGPLSSAQASAVQL